MSNLIIKDDKIICLIPITGVTSKIRIKRRKNNFGNPISVKNNILTNDDYVEWQISYYLPFNTIWDEYRKAKGIIEERIKVFDKLFLRYKDQDIILEIKKVLKTNPDVGKQIFISKIKKILEDKGEIIISKPHKGNKIYVSYELSDILKLALKHKILNSKDIKYLIEYNKNNSFNIEDQFPILRKSTQKIYLNKYEFFEERTPLFINKISDKTFTEIILQHKQKAVGYQSMVYFCTYLNRVFDKQEKPIVGRFASEKETILLPITKNDLIGIVESFIVASKDHSWDIKKILSKIV